MLLVVVIEVFGSDGGDIGDDSLKVVVRLPVSVGGGDFGGDDFGAVW